MKRRVAWMLALLVPVGCAVPPAQPGAAGSPATPVVSASGTIASSQQYRTVLSGQRSRLNAAAALNADCSNRDLPIGRVVAAPANGTVNLQSVAYNTTYPPGNQRYECNRKQSVGLGTFYKSHPGFVGEDRTTIEVFFPDLSVSQITEFIIMVK
jgi:hypothetical protein